MEGLPDGAERQIRLAAQRASQLDEHEEEVSANVDGAVDPFSFPASADGQEAAGDDAVRQEDAEAVAESEEDAAHGLEVVDPVDEALADGLHAREEDAREQQAAEDVVERQLQEVQAETFDPVVHAGARELSTNAVVGVLSAGRARQVLGVDRAPRGLGAMGKGGVKRHRRVLRDTIQGISKGSIRRLCRRGGVKRISGLCGRDV
jgi:hypothetical protein